MIETSSSENESAQSSATRRGLRVPAAPQRLTTHRYWDATHSRSANAATTGRGGDLLHRPILGPIVRRCIEDYADWIRWERLYSRYLPKKRTARALEIGSAPGHHLTKLHRRYGYDVCGIEYSDKGAELNRRVFAAHGLPTDAVIQADFFDQALLDRFHERFDVVISRGFIEHFGNPRLVVNRHVDLLAPGGTLVVTIPNLRGLNRALTMIFQPDLLKIHNLDIMSPGAYRRLFDHPALEERFCAPYGTFSFRIFDTHPRAWSRHILIQGRRCQLMFNLLFRALLRGRGPDSRWTSPYYIYIGQKRPHGVRSS